MFRSVCLPWQTRHVPEMATDSATHIKRPVVNECFACLAQVKDVIVILQVRI